MYRVNSTVMNAVAIWTEFIFMQQNLEYFYSRFSASIWTNFYVRDLEIESLIFYTIKIVNLFSTNIYMYLCFFNSVFNNMKNKFLTVIKWNSILFLCKKEI